MRVIRYLPLAVLAALVSACAAASPRATPIKGTLYLVGTSPDFRLSDVVIKNGLIVSRNTGVWRTLRARDNPKMVLSPGRLHFGGGHIANGTYYTDRTACQPLAISPHGVNAACLRIDGRGTLTVFNLANPTGTQRNSRITVGEYSTGMMGFISDDKLAVVGNDDSCPFYRRSDGDFSDEPRARVKVINMRGAVLSSGPCVHSIVVGEHNRIAYLTHDPSGNALYSQDGRLWLHGQPMAFDGSGHMLLIDGNHNLVDEKGRLIAPNVAGGYWTR